MGIIKALTSFVSKWLREWFSINFITLKKWYVWLSGSRGGIKYPKIKVIKINDKKARKRINKELSNLKQFLILLKLSFGFKKVAFLTLNKNIEKIRKITSKNKTQPFEIELKRDKISKFKTQKAKKLIKIIKTLL